MSPTPDSSNEAEKFLSPDQNGAKVVSSSNGAADDGKLEVGVEDGKGGKEDGEGKKCCTKKCCLVATGVVVGLIVLVVVVGYVRYKTKYEGSAEEATAEELEAILQEAKAEAKAHFDISGNYKMERYDDNYAKFLEVMGVPSLVISLITASGFNELIKVELPDRPNGVWTWTVTKSSGSRANWFRLGEEFEFEYGSKVKGVKHKTCDLDRDTGAELVCDVEEREKGLVMVETYTFSPTGLVQAIEVVSGGQPVKTLRFFEKKTDKQLKDEEEEEEKKAASEPSPFGQDGEDDDDFWEDEKRR